MKRSTYFVGPIGLIVLFAVVAFVSTMSPERQASASATPMLDSANNFTVVATGLNNPRGLRFGPDGKLYVAEGGTGGSNPAVGCGAVDPPVGPYLGSNTGARISSFDNNWNRTTIIDTLPSSQTGPVPTAIAYKGNFFFGNLGTFPVDPGTQAIYKMTPNGQLQTWATGLTTVLGLVIDQHDRMYVLESMTEPGFPGEDQIGSGKVVRIDPNGTQTVIATGLSFPGGMTLGPDGALYVSNLSFGVPPGAGQIVRIEISTSKPGKNQVQTTSQSTPAVRTEAASQTVSAAAETVSSRSIFVGNRNAPLITLKDETSKTDQDLERTAAKHIQ